MSADNGIYIGHFVDLAGNPSEFRVVHAQAIDNLVYESDDSGFNPEQVVLYFQNCNTFHEESEAVLFAHKWAKDFSILEYGISDIHFPLSFNEFVERAKHVKVD